MYRLLHIPLRSVVSTSAIAIIIMFTASLLHAQGPQLSGYHWMERWVTTANSCTKNGIALYETELFISNDGTSPFTVEKMEIVDNPDGVFEFDNTDPATTVNPGLQISPGVSNMRMQKFNFKPKDERTYSARVRLYTTDGDIVESILAGVGIESHISFDGHDFGTIPFNGTPVTANATIEVKVGPTRPTTITGLSNSGVDAAEFNVGAEPWPTP